MGTIWLRSEHPGRGIKERRGIKEPTRRGTRGLGSWGTLEIETGQTGRALRLRRPDRAPVQIEAGGLLEGAYLLHYAFLPRKGYLFMVQEGGDDVYLIDVDAGSLKQLAHLERWQEVHGGYDPGGLDRTVFHAVDEGLLIEYECGLLLIDTEGQVRWVRTHICFSLSDGIYAGIIWFRLHDLWEGQGYPERWGYRIEDGQRVEVPS